MVAQWSGQLRSIVSLSDLVRSFVLFLINNDNDHHHHHHHRPFNFVFLVILPPAASSCSSSFSESILPTQINRCLIPIREMTRNRFLRTDSTVGYCFSFFFLILLNSFGPTERVIELPRKRGRIRKHKIRCTKQHK